MVTFVILAILFIVAVRIFSPRLEEKLDIEENTIIISGIFLGIVLGLAISFTGGSFVKKEAILEKYYFHPMIFNGKSIAALNDGDSFYLLSVDGSKTLMKFRFQKKEIFFSKEKEIERFVEIKKMKPCMNNVWIWFLCLERIQKKAITFKAGDLFLKIPKYEYEYEYEYEE